MPSGRIQKYVRPSGWSDGATIAYRWSHLKVSTPGPTSPGQARPRGTLEGDPEPSPRYVRSKLMQRPTSTPPIRAVSGLPVVRSASIPSTERPNRRATAGRNERFPPEPVRGGTPTPPLTSSSVTSRPAAPVTSGGVTSPACKGYGLHPAAQVSGAANVWSSAAVPPRPLRCLLHLAFQHPRGDRGELTGRSQPRLVGPPLVLVDLTFIRSPTAAVPDRVARGGEVGGKGLPQL